MTSKRHCSFRIPRKSEGGYTLVELVVIMGIIIVLTGLVIANTRVGNQRQQLRDGVAGYVNAAKQAESLAASSQAVNGTSRKAYGVCVSSTATATPCGYSFGQTADEYQVYARQATDTNYAARPSTPDIITTYTLPSPIKFSLLSGFNWIDYLPPGPSLLVNGNGTSNSQCSTVYMTMQIGTSTTYTRRAAIRPCAGAVYVE